MKQTVLFLSAILLVGCLGYPQNWKTTDRQQQNHIKKHFYHGYHDKHNHRSISLHEHSGVSAYHYHLHGEVHAKNIGYNDRHTHTNRLKHKHRAQ